MPRFIKFFSQLNKTNTDIAGGKGASLGEMTGAGLPVPPGFVVLAPAFDRFLEEEDLAVEIHRSLEKINPADTNSVEKASKTIRNMIKASDMPADLQKEIMEAYQKLSGNGKKETLVAVRSSATAEDSNIASWAGELETFLNTDKKNLIERVAECWSSLFTPRAIVYAFEKGVIKKIKKAHPRKKNGLPEWGKGKLHASVAVVVQKMIQSEISGITFTVHPVTRDRHQMIIEAGYGLGEAIVSGQITPDSYVIDKRDFAIVDINIGRQERKIARKKTLKTLKALKALKKEANEWVNVPKNLQEKQKLAGRQIVEIAKICKKIEEHYQFPCDIEWAYEGKKFYITQSRPITTL